LDSSISGDHPIYTALKRFFGALNFLHPTLRRFERRWQLTPRQLSNERRRPESFHQP
jgi:hypothetical protein